MKFLQQAKNSILAALSISAIIGQSDKDMGLVQGKISNYEVLFYYLINGEDEVPLLDVIEDLDRYFDSPDDQSFPNSFEFPISFQYNAAFA